MKYLSIFVISLAMGNFVSHSSEEEISIDLEQPSTRGNVPAHNINKFSAESEEELSLDLNLTQAENDWRLTVRTIEALWSLSNSAPPIQTFQMPIFQIQENIGSIIKQQHGVDQESTKTETKTTRTRKTETPKTKKTTKTDTKKTTASKTKKTAITKTRKKTTPTIDRATNTGINKTKEKKITRRRLRETDELLKDVHRMGKIGDDFNPRNSRQAKIQGKKRLASIVEI